MQGDSNDVSAPALKREFFVKQALRDHELKSTLLDVGPCRLERTRLLYSAGAVIVNVHLRELYEAMDVICYELEMCRQYKHTT